MEITNRPLLMVAPLQGHTDAAYRHFHHLLYNSGEIPYSSPFIRLEKGEIRTKDTKDISSELNDNLNFTPQIIFKDKNELQTLTRLLKSSGFKKIDLNFGCPFPLQTSRGRGAAAISSPILGDAVIETVKENPEIEFSVKMRLGMNSPEEWKELLPNLNQVTLTHIAVHPRVAKQQYKGELNVEQFKSIVEHSNNPVIFNGDIKTPEDISKRLDQFKGIAGIMAGRGLLARPSLFKEFIEGQEWDSDKRIEKMLEFHRLLFTHYSEILCGDSQILSKIKPFWEYAEEEIGRKPWKEIKKAVNLAKYMTAVATIRG